MNGMRSTIQYLGFYVAPVKYREHSGLYVFGKDGITKVAVFSNREKAKLFLETLEMLFEQTDANWDLIGPCNNWDREFE